MRLLLQQRMQLRTRDELRVEMTVQHHMAEFVRGAEPHARRRAARVTQDDEGPILGESPLRKGLEAPDAEVEPHDYGPVVLEQPHYVRDGSVAQSPESPRLRGGFLHVLRRDRGRVIA